MKKEAVTLACALVGCVGPIEPAESDGTWVGTITTEGNVTTVVNESGSVWGGTARLLEEASIGVEAGPQEQMFGWVIGVAITNDRIFVLDRRPPVVRVYDSPGEHILNISSEGQGPGEIRRPTDVAIGPDGTVFVRQTGRISAFDQLGNPIRIWSDGVHSSITPMRMVATDAGVLYNPQIIGYERLPTQVGQAVAMVPYSMGKSIADPIPEPRFDLDIAWLGQRPGTRRPVPFWPIPAWAVTPGGAVVSGIPTSYRFRVERPDGTTTVMERSIDAVPLDPEEAAWHVRKVTAINRYFAPDWEWTAPEIPRHKPYFQEFYADDSGRIWVRRKGPGIRLRECDERPDPKPLNEINDCWKDELIIDIFDADGRYLGEVGVPDPIGRFRQMDVHGDRVGTQLEDEAGTIMVKRYRLVLPGEEER